MQIVHDHEFLRCQPPQPLADDEIHLWFFAPDTAPTAKSAPTSLLHELLSTYLQTDPAMLRFDRTPYGKPFLLPPHDTYLQFNLAHSADALIVALSRAQTLGVDIEAIQRPRPWLELARRFFTAAEYAALAALPPERLPAAFVELWSAKEAVLKALGRGIAFGLERLEFALDPHGRVAGLRTIAAEGGAPADWQLLRLAPGSGLCGTLAWRGPSMRVCSFRASGSGNPNES